ncbi:DEAD/DEAH box helicase [Burkholderiaceae bacterium DAT-1]|nr:DEAD/DEAH box helicase [Burkholderiaceae bacterium DAT-1]
MTFASLGLIEPLLKSLAEQGYTQPTPVQAQAIPAILEGRDIMAAAQTGTGKTAGFGLPLLQRLSQVDMALQPNCVRGLILVPTRELAEQVSHSIRTYGQHLRVSSFAVYGGVSINPQMMRLRRGVDILVATPGRLIDLMSQNAVKLKHVHTLVLDEADRMLDMGFVRELNTIFAALPQKRQTLLFSATFSDTIRSMAVKLLNDPIGIEVTPRNEAAKTVQQSVITCDKQQKPALFCHLYESERWEQVLVFVKTRRGVDKLVKTLAAQGVEADSIHGDKSQPARLKALARFKSGEARILVATDVAARGLDIEELPLVINFDMPVVAEDYVHRIGRTGRAGASGHAISLVCADEVDLLKAVETLIKQNIPREEIRGFEAEHRVPLTNGAAFAPKRPKKPKAPKILGEGGQTIPLTPGSRKPKGAAPKPAAKPAVQGTGNQKPAGAKPATPKAGAPKPAGAASGTRRQPNIPGRGKGKKVGK